MNTSFPNKHTKTACTLERYSYWQDIKLSYYGQKIKKIYENLDQK